MMSNQHLKEKFAESARYALLRRLAPVLRHNLAGSLQPLSMMAILIEKRLQKPSPDLAALARNSSQLNTAAREASSACMSLVTWLAPNISDLVTVTAGISDVTDLVTTELGFKGYTLINQIGEVPAEIPRSLTRHVFMAALIALTDATVAPASVILEAQLINKELLLTISIRIAPGGVLSSGVPAYRHLDWDDVQALAEFESVQLTHSANRVELRCPLNAPA